MRYHFLAGVFVWCASLLSAQQTIFNVPNADVLERGKVYLELDATFLPADRITADSPRVVVGLGRSIEAGINLGPFSNASGSAVNLSPTVKWKVHDWKKQRLSLIVGDGLFVPLKKSSFNLGNYAYVEIAQQWRSTRITAGVNHFSSGVIAAHGRLGGQFGVEQQLTQKVFFAADWFTGNNSAGYFTPGMIVKVSKRVTIYPAYQFGNHGITKGNHQFLVELGWNLN